MELKGNQMLLQSEELDRYILETSIYPREPKILKELRDATASHPMAFMGTLPSTGQFLTMLLNLINAKKTIEVGVFTGYSLLLTALTVPEDGKVIAVDVDRASYEIGLPIIQKSGVGHKIDFVESEALPLLDQLLEKEENEGSFDFAFVDADKGNYWNYHERLMKLVKVGGVIVYDNTLWGGTVAMPENLVLAQKRKIRLETIEFNTKMAADTCVELCHAPIGDGITICRRLC